MVLASDSGESETLAPWGSSGGQQNSKIRVAHDDMINKIFRKKCVGFEPTYNAGFEPDSKC